MILKASQIAEPKGLRSRTVTHAYQAATILSNGLRRLHAQQLSPVLRTPDGRLEALSKWWDEVTVYDGIVETAETVLRQRLTNASVMAVALATSLL